MLNNLQRMSQKRELIVLGSGTSQGVPVIGCYCSVCESADPRDNRTRSSVHIHFSELSLHVVGYTAGWRESAWVVINSLRGGAAVV